METAGLHGRTPEEFRAVLDEYGLQAVSSHVGLGELRAKVPDVAAGLRTLGSQWAVVPWVGKDEYGPGWATFAASLAPLSDALIRQGLALGYHNHAFEFEPEGGRPGYEVFWEATPPGVIAQLDLYWVWDAGQDPVAWLRRLKGRVPLTHFKDGHRGAKFTPVGEGELDWAAIVPAAREAGVKWAIVELDESPRDPLDCVLASREYLLRQGLED